MMRKFSFLFILLFTAHLVAFAQEETQNNPVISAVPSLTIAPDS